jgi:hypothetical protein
VDWQPAKELAEVAAIAVGWGLAISAKRAKKRADAEHAEAARRRQEGDRDGVVAVGTMSFATAFQKQLLTRVTELEHQNAEVLAAKNECLERGLQLEAAVARMKSEQSIMREEYERKQRALEERVRSLENGARDATRSAPQSGA